MRVENYMSRAPITVRVDTDYWKASEIMQEKDLHHIPVINESEKIVGILTLRDLKIAAMHFGEAHVEVSEVMHSPVVTVAPGEPLAEAARQMVDNRIGGLPVLDNNGQIVGILTETDLLRALIDQLGKETA
ncbi:MAG: CBS domain-containing protein [Gammaproteobacteria bacterium]|nr:MAG: CBS domain-containing protein [Gammaproteobacteria bacterium]UCH38716.1 MAG: CBS domain-containing protein [Gammaproteobacteria bacterium]